MGIQYTVPGIVQPKKSPNHAKDLATFESLAARDTDMQIENCRYRGPEGGGGRYALDRDPMYVWAGVYRGPVREIPEVSLQNVDRGKLLVLHAATRAHEVPEIFSKSGQRTSKIS